MGKLGTMMKTVRVKICIDATTYPNAIVIGSVLSIVTIAVILPGIVTCLAPIVTVLPHRDMESESPAGMFLFLMFISLDYY